MNSVPELTKRGRNDKITEKLKRDFMVEVVAALIKNSEKFMICRRPAHKARGDLWEFVGGKVEKGETKRQALIRECREELSVTVTVGRTFAQVKHVYPDVTVHITLYEAQITEGEPRLNEHSDIKWITPEEIPLYRFCPADEVFLQKVKELFAAEVGEADQERNTVYILECSDGTLYTGWTNDLTARLETHNKGKGGKYTRSRLPVKLIYSETFATPREARSREWHIKRLSRAEKLRLIKKDR